MQIEEIMKRLPHRYPILLIDKVLEIIPDKSIIAIKNVTINEQFFDGHFPNRPVMPGVLIIEAFAQAAALFSFTDERINYAISINAMAFYLVGIDEAKFRKPVIPGDQLRLEVHAERIGRSICKYSAKALVDNYIVAEAKLMCAIRKL